MKEERKRETHLDHSALRQQRFNTDFEDTPISKQRFNRLTASLWPPLCSPSGDDSDLIMEPSLSSNTAKDHFTIYHMDFNPLIGPLVNTYFLKALMIWSLISSSMGKKYTYLIQLWGIKTMYTKLLAQGSCRVSGKYIFWICYKTAQETSKRMGGKPQLKVWHADQIQ